MSYLQFSVTDSADAGAAGEARVLELQPGLSLSEIARLARAFARTGITRVRLAGGEPLLRDEVVAIVETFARQPGIGVVAMTTDGVHLAQYAEPLLWAGLQRLTVTLESLDRETYRQLTGQDALPQVLAGLELARQLPFQHLCVQVAVRAGRNTSELPAFVDFARRTGLTVRFTELPRDEGNPEWEAQFVPAVEIRSCLGGLGLRWETRGRAARAPLPGGGTVEIVAPVSEPAPRPWLHLQVSAIGRLTAVEKQTPEEDLRPWLTSPELEARVRDAMRRLGE